MSMRCFLAVDKPLRKTEYYYKDILPSITEEDMFFNDKIYFSEKLTEEETVAIGNIFRDFHVYSIYSGFQLSYEPRLKQVISSEFAINALDELKWFRAFIKKSLEQNDIFMVLNLWLGRKTNFNLIKTRCINIDDWELTDDKIFEFLYGTIYQFTDNSEASIKRRRLRMKGK